MQKTQLVMAFLFGGVVALGAALAVTAGHGNLPAAYGQTAGNNEMLMVATNDQTNQNNHLFVIDSKNARLACYVYGNGKLALTSVRNITYDMKIYDMPAAKGELSVSDIQKAAQEADTNSKGGGKAGG